MSSRVGDHFRGRAGGQGTEQAAGAAVDELVLLDSGLDSLCFAILVVRLEQRLGFDPFSAAEDVYFPVTFGDFVRFYDCRQP